VDDFKNAMRVGTAGGGRFGDPGRPFGVKRSGAGRILFRPASFALLLLFFLGGRNQVVKSPKIDCVRFT